MVARKSSKTCQGQVPNPSGLTSSASRPIDDSLLPHFVALRDVVYQSFIIQSIHAAAKAGIADTLIGGPKDIEAVADETGNNPDATYRLMRALAGIGIFEEVSTRRFALTPKAELLRRDHPYSLRPLALLVGEPQWREPWGNLMYSVQTGQPSWDYTFGQDLWGYMNEHEDAMELFHGYLTVFSKANCPVIASSYPFSQYRKVVDVGGGRGSLLAHILRQHPSVRGVLFDQPEVIQGPTEIDEDIAPRCELVGGDFFEEVPSGGDIYLLQQILHDWNDERAATILTNCRRAMTDDGRVLVIDAVLAPANEEDMNKFMDLHMMVAFGSAKERSEPEFRTLFQDAGLELTGVYSTTSVLSFSIVEGSKL